MKFQRKMLSLPFISNYYYIFASEVLLNFGFYIITLIGLAYPESNQ